LFGLGLESAIPAAGRAADEGRKGLQLINFATCRWTYSANRLPEGTVGGNVRTHRYRITVGGGLGTIVRQAFEEFKIESNGAHTLLIADLDQAALYGALNRIQSLGLELVELARTSTEAA
jgi:hypothetical protein